MDTRLLSVSSHPQACVYVAPAWHSCQHFEVDASLPDAAMETKGWGNRQGPEEVWGRGRPSHGRPLTHCSWLVVAGVGIEASCSHGDKGRGGPHPTEALFL